MTEKKYVDPFEEDTTKSLADAATEINLANERTATNSENSIGTMVHQRYIEGAINPQGNGEQ